MGIFILIIIVLVFGIGIGFMMGFSRAMREAARNLQSPSRSLCIIGRIAIVIGIIALIAEVCVSLYTWHFIRTAQRTTGTVIQMTTEIGTNSDSNSRGTAPIFEFMDANGQIHTIASHVYSYPPQFHVGDVVTVLYRKEDPQGAEIDSFMQIWLFSMILGITTVVDLLVGSVLLLWPMIAGRFKR